MSTKKEIDNMHTIFNLKQRVNDFESQEQENENNSRKLTKLYDMKIINYSPRQLLRPPDIESRPLDTYRDLPIPITTFIH